MGQSSSQVEPTPATPLPLPLLNDMEQAVEAAAEEQEAHESRVNKRSRIDTTITTTATTTSTTMKRSRGRPQHKRGTAIRPSMASQDLLPPQPTATSTSAAIEASHTQIPHEQPSLTPSKKLHAKDIQTIPPYVKKDSAKGLKRKDTRRKAAVSEEAHQPSPTPADQLLDAEEDASLPPADDGTVTQPIMANNTSKKRRRDQKESQVEDARPINQKSPDGPHAAIHDDAALAQELAPKRQKTRQRRGNQPANAIDPSSGGLQAYIIPTPPKSAELPATVAAVAAERQLATDEDHGAEDHAGADRMNPTKRIRNWLRSDDFAPPPPSRTISPSPELTRASTKKKRKSDAKTEEPDVSVKKRKAQSKVAEEDPTPPKTKRQKSTGDRGSKSGTWTTEEKAVADATWATHLRRNPETSDDELRAAISDWKTAGTIKTDMAEAFPERTLPAIRKFCQRHFTLLISGPWTAEEDAQLKQEYARKPNNWAEIAAVLGRTPDSVRDRWRNSVQDADTRRTGAWSVEEERLLAEAVEECYEDMREKNHELDDGMINWGYMNERSGGMRSARRCREKWQDMQKRRGRQTNNASSEVFVQGTIRNEKKYESLRNGDLLDALTDVVKGMEGRMDEVFPYESTFWAVVAQKRTDTSAFVGDAKLRRRAYYGALDRYVEEEGVKAARGMARKAEAMMKILEKTPNLKRTSDISRSKKRRSGLVSEDLVVESEDES